MANYQQHLTQWKHNRSFLGSISTTYPDWIVTVAFYVALHATDSLLAHDGISRVHSHDTRNNVLMQTRRYEHIWRHYRPPCMTSHEESDTWRSRVFGCPRIAFPTIFSSVIYTRWNYPCSGC
jgi:hypothetical protein